MPGFYVTNMPFCGKGRNNLSCINNMANSKMFVNPYRVERVVINQFLDEKLFENNKDLILVTDGLILNSEILKKRYDKKSLVETITEMEAHNPQFFSEFRGDFSGAFYSKEKDVWTFWIDQMGFNALFYYKDDDHFIVSSQVDWILDELKRHEIIINLDSQAVYSMLTYGFMFDDRTYVNEIHRLLPGHYLQYDGNKHDIHVSEYYSLEYNKLDLSQKSLSEIIDEIDEIISNSVKMSFDKDNQYGYRHLADLSGGLDCRMVSYVAKKLGYSDLTNIHYSANESTEQILTKRIAKDLGSELIIKSLDDCSYVFDIDEIVKMNYGLSIYYGITGGKRLLQDLNFSLFGIEEMGLNGDNILGGPSSMDEVENKPDRIVYPYSYKLEHRVEKDHLKKYQSIELCRNDIRGRLGSPCPSLIRRYYTEIWDPFSCPELFDYVFSLPPEIRMNYNLYYNWIRTKYPEATKIPRESTGCRITAPPIVVTLKRLIKKGPRKLLNMLGLKINDRDGMHPLDNWLRLNHRLSSFINTYFTNSFMAFSKWNKDEQMNKDIEYLFNVGSFNEKMQVLTVLASWKYFFMECHNESSDDKE